VQAAADTHTPLSSKGRGLSLLELVLGGAIVIGHNVFHLLPNEVPILVVLGLVSIRLREGSWPAIGLGRPKSWWRTIAIAFAAAILVLAADQFITEPLARAIGLHANAGAAANALGDMKGHAWNALKGLVIVWTFAAFGEEIGYRRYLLAALRMWEIALPSPTGLGCSLSRCRSASAIIIRVRQACSPAPAMA
jgi:membrane protease YdiL (CAAX protease family)